MKKIILFFGIFTISIFYSKAQIIPIDEHDYYNKNGDGPLKKGTYLKDVNGILNKYVGTWKGTYKSKQYEFRAVKRTFSYLGIKEDGLLMRYKVTNNNGVVIENILDLPDDDIYVLAVGFYDKFRDHYIYNYNGRDTDCGQNGKVYTKVYGTGNKKMKLSVVIYGEADNCTKTSFPEILPVKWMELTKQ